MPEAIPNHGMLAVTLPMYTVASGLLRGRIDQYAITMYSYGWHQYHIVAMPITRLARTQE